MSASSECICLRLLFEKERKKKNQRNEKKNYTKTSLFELECIASVKCFEDNTKTDPKKCKKKNKNKSTSNKILTTYTMKRLFVHSPSCVEPMYFEVTKDIDCEE